MQHYEPKPTKYKGIQFRSKLEATWAVFLDHNWHVSDWEYEPKEFPLFPGSQNTYTPDFRLHCDSLSFWLEVKPAIPSEDCLAMLNNVAHHSRLRLLLGVGSFFNDEPDIYKLPADKYISGVTLHHSLLNDARALTMAQTFRFDLMRSNYQPPPGFKEVSHRAWEETQRRNKT